MTGIIVVGRRTTGDGKAPRLATFTSNRQPAKTDTGEPPEGLASFPPGEYGKREKRPAPTCLVNGCRGALRYAHHGMKKISPLQAKAQNQTSERAVGLSPRYSAT